MSQILIHQYLNELNTLKKISGTLTEGVVSEAFKDLLKAWSKQNNLVFVSQYGFQSTQKTLIRPDGTILHDLRVPLGYWEAKDTADDLDDEIRKKLAKGYPRDNIIFENSHTAVLYQNGQEVMRTSMTDVEYLGKLVSLFFSYERQEIADFRKAVKQFTLDLPAVLEALRTRITDAYFNNDPFKVAAAAFLAQAKSTINPSVTEADVFEMLIQHILTEEIFTHVFNEGDFHRENNIAHALYELEGKFFTGGIKRDTLKALEPYYAAIRANAAQITSHSEKQTFLKVVYENFYKVYNPKAADRLGVVYTPNEIVRFMIEGTDWLTKKHFDKHLIDRDVQILDPATGTGTFICELIEHFRGQPEKLAHKYKEELHANEVAILPYYVANLNIEATYAAISGQFSEFPSLCFVDTLDNVAGLGIYSGFQHDLFGAIADENVARIKRQNQRSISVIIGNPPYNANQQNENDNNKNRTYARIDERIKETYIRQSTAQKTKLYDMYARFFRWASDRLNRDGVLCMITNRSFIDSRTFDGFRKVVAEEFNEIYVVDLGGDVRANPKLSGTKHNVFGIQTGVAISFFVKRHKQKGYKIFYARRPEFDTAEDKLSFLSNSKLSSLRVEQIEPDKKHNWVGLTDNDWDNLIPLADKKTKAAKAKGQERAIIKNFVSGIKTNRDEWVYDFDSATLSKKASYFTEKFLAQSADEDFDLSIKWSRDLKAKFLRRTSLRIDPHIVYSTWRPFVRKNFLWVKAFNDIFYTDHESTFGKNGGKKTRYIAISGTSSAKPFQVLAGDSPQDYEAIEKSNLLPRYCYTSDGERIDNVTDWGLKQFQSRYGKNAAISKDDIFAYCYGVLHDPVYRETYALNLKREFPRLPFYDDFQQWRDWGQTLLDLHIGFEAAEPFALERIDTPDSRARAAGLTPLVKLKSDHETSVITLDSETKLTGVPEQAWTYRLGNRSAIDWVLDQYKEKTPKDKTIREKFNTYRFAEYKEKVIDLLCRVTTVSVATQKIVEDMVGAHSKG
ncbi:endonuclease and methylase LlaGI [Asticcacaulis biprosthecium C19]|uniref:site-specific DNA-methyltransferase (adenine-specific) n=1 Tax=Asticcacaulis biprosthecium C19 TaxID=715226 RepID=F4QP69_9CAUL|nr:type ISP restriction/modification enzyme [Asticcacaulis biprosthecium]EGF91127.1 endonuclease and methylase LlaGI [Asticcacaulis biprosthecium C19]